MSIEAMKQALEALEQDNPLGRSATITALRAAIEQAEKKEMTYDELRRLSSTKYKFDLECMEIREKQLMNTNSPAAELRKEWVGLTDDEIKEIIGSWAETPIKGYTRKLFDQIEAKLREKNT